MEEWRLIVDFPDYEVSSTGLIRNIKRQTILKKSTNSYGYKVLSLYKDKKDTSVRVNRIVALSFIPNPENKPCVNHIDGDKANDNVSNLEWCTYSENEIHSVKVLGKKPNKAWLGKFNEDNRGSKPIKQLTKDGVLIKTFPSLSEAGRSGFSVGCISQVCNGKKELHKKFKWSFN